MSDILACMLSAAARWLKDGASPGIGFNILHLPPAHTVEALERDEIDVADQHGTGPLERDSRPEAAARPYGVRHARVASDRAAGDHRIRDFLAQEHMKVSMSPTDMRFVDDVLGELGHERTIMLNVPHWLVVPHVLKQTDLLVVMPGRLAAALNDEACWPATFRSSRHHSPG